MSRELMRGRGLDHAPRAAHASDGPASSPAQAAEERAQRLREEVETAGRQVDAAIAEATSAPEWNVRKSKLQERVVGLEKRLRAKSPRIKSDESEQATRDLQQAHEQLSVIKDKLREDRRLRAVAPLAGELGLEPAVLARTANLDKLFLWAAELSAPDRRALSQRIRRPSDEDRFAKELHNQISAARCFFDFQRVLEDPKALRAGLRERLRAQGGATSGDDPAQIAERGVADASEPLPHAQTLQPLFGRHDLSRIKAQVGGPAAEAARALGAEAYVIGDRVGFTRQPDLNTAAHEAVHIVDGHATTAREAGLDAGDHDPRELRAEAIADAVQRGERVEAQLDRSTSATSAMATVHRKREGAPTPAAHQTELARYLTIHEIDLRDALRSYLGDAGWPSPAPDVGFAGGGEGLFTGRFFKKIRDKLADADLMQRLVSPGDLVERFHRYVDVRHPMYSPRFGMGLAQLVQWAARDALVERVGPRYRKLWASRSEPPDADELTGAHPMDEIVAEALTFPGVVNVLEVPAIEPEMPAVASSPPPKRRTKATARNHHDQPVTSTDGGGAPTVQQVMDVERDIGVWLGTIRQQVAGVGFADGLRGANDARAARVQLLADTDAATRARYLPVLQFQHTQLIAISSSLASLVERYWPLRGIPAFGLTAARRAERDELHDLISTYVRAAAVSHDEKRSTAILRRIEIRARQKARDEIDRGQIAAELDTRDTVTWTPYRAPIGTTEGLDAVARQRQAMIDGTATGRSKYEQQKAVTTAGEVSLNARMQSAEHALEQLRSAAVEVFGDMEAMRLLFPQLRPLPDVILDVKDHLADVSRTWRAAIDKATPLIQDDPHAPDDWCDWQGRHKALPIAEEAFAKIAGDQDLVTFLNDAATTIRHQAIINAIVQLAAALLITLAVGMGAAALGARVAAAIATEDSTIALRGIAFAADVSVNATINTAVQLAMSPERTRNADGSERGDAHMATVAVVENALMELFTRGLMGPVRNAQKAWKVRAREISELPNLSKDERALFSSFDFAGTQLTAEFLGGMTTQWAAHRLIEAAHQSGEEVSESFALTVLQQGAAVGLGKFFHGKLEAWKKHRDALAKTRLGKLPEMKALFAAREAFYARAKALEESLSPEPTAMQELLRLNEALLAQERALVASHPREAGPTTERSRAEQPRSADDGEHDAPRLTSPRAHSEASTTKVDDVAHVGQQIAAEAGAIYLGEGRFAVDGVTVEVRRTSGTSKVRVEGDHGVIEIAKGLHGAQLEHAVAAKLAEVREQHHAPGAFEVTAAAVPGSSFKGKGEHRATEHELLGEASHALDALAARQKNITSKVERAHVDPDARPDVQDAAANTRVLHLADGTSITVRVSVAPLEHQDVARSVMNPTKQGVTMVDRERAGGHEDVHVEEIKGRYVIQLSDKMEAGNVRRAVAHELAEILARRELHLQNKVPGMDVLRAGGDLSGPLSPHDRGRIAEIDELARDIRSSDPAVRERGRHELMALVEDMGLRAGTDGADARFERIKPELREAAREELSRTRVREGELAEGEQKKLEWTREEARADRKAQAAYDKLHAPSHEVPTTGVGRKATKSERETLARKARAERAQRNRQTLDQIRRANAQGTHPKMKLQIGGNAALAARDPHALLVDANQRWAVDRSELLAQTAQQMEPIKAAGIGDPYEFAGPSERVPIEALHYWQDTIAAQGPLVDGRAEVGIAADGRTLIATIHPNDGSPAVTVEIEGVPVISSGFTHENAPGVRNQSPRQALNKIDQALVKLVADPAVGAAAQKAREQIAKLHGQAETDAGKALEAIAGDLRAKLVTDRDAATALGTLETTHGFAELRQDAPGHVLYGDEANRIADEQILAMRDVVIAGPGGTGISAAEIILGRNPKARVSMIGKDPPAGLAENDQFRAVVANYGTKELCAKLHIEPGRIEGRFEFHDGYLLGPAKLEGGKYDANARPQKAGGKPLASEAAQGDTYISAMGRFADAPPAVAALADRTERAGGTVWKEALMDDDGFYTGYQLVIQRPDKTVLRIDVTGAASRYADQSTMSDDHSGAVKASREHDAPPESGIFDGSYAASARQAARYRARRHARGY